MQELRGRILLLVNTGSNKKRFSVQALKNLGLTIIALNDEVNWAKPYVDHWVIADSSSATESIAKLEEFLVARPELRPDGALTFWEDAVLLTSMIVDHFSLKGISHPTALLARNKFAFRKFCEEHGLPAPKHCLLTTDEDIEKATSEFKFPVVVKPVYGSSSAYVVKANDLDELRRIARYLRESLDIKLESALRDGFDILVEEYLDGHEVDIDILLQNGKVKFWSISDNDKCNEPFFVETGQAIPSRLPEEMQAQLLALAEETTERLGIRDACLHFEAKATARGPVPIEVNLRMGGDEVYYFVKEAWGVDLITHAVKIAFGIYFPPIKRRSTPRKYLCGKYYLSEHSGIVSTLRFPEDLKRQSGIVEFQFFKRTGDAILVPPDGYDYLGWIAVSGSTYNAAEENLDKAFSRVEVSVAPFQQSSAIGQTIRKSNLSEATLRKETLLGAVKIAHLRGISSASQRTLRVGIAANIYENSGKLNEDELTSDARHIHATLEDRGYSVKFYNFNRALEAAEEIRKDGIQLVFNVAERINDTSLLEPHAAALLDILQVPYTGSNPFTLSLCLDKIRVKKLLSFHKIPTPKWDYAYDMDDEIRNDLAYPLIVKPANSDSSIGITNQSVVTDARQLSERLEMIVQELGRPALVEEFIEGDEYDVSIMGNHRDNCRVLPLSRSLFGGLPEGLWHIYPYEGKFGDTDTYKQNIEVQRPPKNISKKLVSLITEMSLDTYSILGCGDYGRIEVRVDKQGNPFVLELNPNPSIGEKDCVPSVAKLIGMDYGDFLEEIIALTIQRYKDRPPYHYLQANLL